LALFRVILIVNTLNRILKYIDEAEAGGAKILVDGRSWGKENKGYWVGPTVILHENPADKAMHDEIFGPVISIYRVFVLKLTSISVF